MNKFLNLFSFCKVIHGKENAILCDFQKKNIKYIPPSMVEVITMLSNHEYNEVEIFFSDQKKVFKSYINLLLKENFAFFSDSREEFIPISDVWESPQTINNVIVEYNYGNYNILNLIEQLDNLNCQFLELRFLSFDEKNLNEISEILQFCNDFVLRSIRIYLPFISNEISMQIYHRFSKFKKLEVTVFYGSHKTKTRYHKQNTLFTKKTMEYIRKTNFDDADLIIDFEYYREALKYNPYYNKKICVNHLGYIKNCLKNETVFGNIAVNNITEVLDTTSIKELWHVSHDMIVDMKDNELRYNRILSNDLKKISEGLYEIIY